MFSGAAKPDPLFNVLFHHKHEHFARFLNTYYLFISGPGGGALGWGCGWLGSPGTGGFQGDGTPLTQLFFNFGEKTNFTPIHLCSLAQVCREVCSLILGNYFLVFLESSETYADPSLNEIGAKLYFSSKLEMKLKIKILLNEKILKNRKILFEYVSEYWAYFGTRNSICPLLEGAGVCIAFSRKHPDYNGPIQKPYGWKKYRPFYGMYLKRFWIRKRKGSPPDGTLQELVKGAEPCNCREVFIIITFVVLSSHGN